jgi:uncharacterized RDD family membrane protein YckC
VDQELAVLSPEKTILTYRLAALGSRIVAHLFDLILLMAVIMGVNITVAMVLSADPMLAQVITGIASILGTFLYFILLEGLWNGQTVGKKALGIRVRMTDGTPVTFTAALGRNLMRLADFVPGFYFAGMLAMFTTPRSQRLGDLVSGTVVVMERRAIPRFTPAPHVAGIHPLEQYVGDLRGMTNEEYIALRRFADRFPELPVDVQKRLIVEVWHPIANRRGVRSMPNVHPIYLAEAVVMKYGREHGLL